MKKRFGLLLTMVFCLTLAACAPGETQEPTQPTRAQQSTKPSAEMETPDDQQPTQPSLPQQEMCWHCGEVAIRDGETYCVNCRCLKCDRRRKLGGDYLYCSEHNCNESLCEYPAFEDSQYCTEHKCSKPNCDNRRWPGSEYCAHHK